MIDHPDAPGSGADPAGVGSWRLAAAPMATLAVVLVAVAPLHGPHWDELYFGMLPPRWWYVDQPPLTVWLTWLAGLAGGPWWLQRLPAVAAAVVGVWVAGLFPRTLGAGADAQQLACWAHAFTVYPLLMGHLFTTGALDLLVWQATILLVLRAVVGRPAHLVWAGVVGGLGAWNKLLVVVLVGALFVGLVVGERRLLRTPQAWWGAAAFAVLAAPQVAAQFLGGLPMASVSAGLVAQQGGLVRLVLLPALALFAGPPLLLVWVRGLLDPWRLPDRPGRFLLPTVVLLVAWTFLFPAQPHYPAGAVLPALALGWASPWLRRRWSPGKRRLVVGANSAVALVLCLPLLPAVGPWFPVLSGLNPTLRDQVGWPGYAQQITAQRQDGEALVIDTYALAGAVHRYGTPKHRAVTHSGHNALWDLGPPRSERVLLVGPDVVAQRSLFAACSPATPLVPLAGAHPRLLDQPMVHCSGPVGGWAAVWPRLRRLSG